jgi:hypothetical protein
MAEPSVSPVGRFSPAPGIFVDRTMNDISIVGTMEMFGPEATPARAASVQHTINTTWTQSFPDGYSISCQVTVNYRPPGKAASNVAQIEAIKMAGPSNVAGSDHDMTLNANESLAFAWTAAHEFGHVIGLQDRYSESIMSSLRGRFGGTRQNTVDPRYTGNLMSTHQGILESKNIRDVAVENQPSEWWFNDDDQIRDWVNHHPLRDITAMSGTSKLRMIKTLMGGWVSEADVAAIVRICSSVEKHAEAETIRAGVPTTDLENFGQRTRVRIALAQMP